MAVTMIIIISGVDLRSRRVANKLNLEDSGRGLRRPGHGPGPSGGRVRAGAKLSLCPGLAQRWRQPWSALRCGRAKDTFGPQQLQGLRCPHLLSWIPSTRTLGTRDPDLCHDPGETRVTDSSRSSLAPALSSPRGH